jgi:toxin ParE1/3/4
VSAAQARILEAAFDDLESAYYWYEDQRPGLGAEFVLAVEAAIASVVAFPDAHAVVHRHVRRFLVERFPYGLFYRLDRDGVIVVACLHAARDPQLRQSRLGRS